MHDIYSFITTPNAIKYGNYKQISEKINVKEIILKRTDDVTYLICG
jgi:hypothetical protein